MDLFEVSEGERAWEDADQRQRQELAKRLEAVSTALDELRNQLDAIATEVELGP
jgi:hypothetical protein